MGWGVAVDAGVVLAGEPSQPRTPERICTSDITTAAGPEEIPLAGIFLLPVDMPDLDVSLGTAEAADGGARWRVGIGAVTQCPIRDGGFLAAVAPIDPPPGVDQSKSSSSSPSSSSSSSPLRMSSAFPIASIASSRFVSGA